MNLRTLLYGTATLLALAGSANAAVVANLGVNPNSTTGAFQSPIGGVGGDGLGPFTDQVVFTLSGGPAFLTIASATNVFAKPSDIITNFNGSVWFTNNTVSLADDIRIIGPIAATPCPVTPNCQGFSGSTILTLLGTYYLELAGSGGGTSGYGGNLAVAQVPIPGALALFASGLVGLGVLARRRKKLEA